jgi:dTDP-4-amino-4,6-dideoxygalactose transaminase
MNAAYLWAQLQEADKINNDRLASWQKYHDAFELLEKKGAVRRPIIPDECKHNAHMYYLITESLDTRTKFISYLKENGVMAVFHYVPLHSAPAGKRFGRFNGEDVYTTRESERLTRLPMYYKLTEEDNMYIISKVKEFYGFS